MDEILNLKRPHGADTDWIKMTRPSSEKDVDDYIPVAGVQLPDSEKDFGFQLKYGQNNQLLRAQRQPWYEQAGLMVGNAVANTATGLLEGLGYLGSLATEYGDDRDYSNWLTQTMQKWHNPLGEIYREQPNKTFDLSDPAWWFENIQQLGESAGAFALEGAGLAKIFGGLATEAAEAMKLGKLGKTIATGTANTLSSGLLAYTEGAMSGYRIYDDAYKTNYKKFVDRGENPVDADLRARHIASQAASTTVQLNTLMNTALNLTALAPLFKNEEDLITNWAQTKGLGARAEGESLASWKKRLQVASFDDPELKKILMHRHGVTSLTSEAIQEGVEEVNTQYAEHEGRRVADNNGKERSWLASLSDLSQYFDDVTDSEGALNFVLGAFGGVAQTALLDHVPIKRVVKYAPDGTPLYKQNTEGQILTDKNGRPQYQTKLVSSKTYNEDGTKTYFTNVRDAVVKDINYMEDLHSQLLQAAAEKNDLKAQLIRDKIFHIQALDSVNKGLTKSWQQTYKDIAALDNSTPLSQKLQPQIDELNNQLQQAAAAGDAQATAQLTDARNKLLAQQNDLAETTEAMQRGFAKHIGDDSYKQKALSAVTDLDHLQRMHDSIQREYTDPLDPASGELADALFFRQSDLYLKRKTLDQYKSQIEKEQMELQHLLGIAGEMNAADHPLLKMKQENLQKAEQDYQKTVEAFNHATSKEGIAEFLKKAKKEREAFIKSQDQKNKTANTEAYLRQQEKEGAAKLDEKQKQVLREQNIQKIAEIQQKINDLHTEWLDTHRKIGEAHKDGSFKNFGKIIKLREKQTKTDNYLKSLMAEQKTLMAHNELLGIQQQQAAEKTQQVQQETIEDDLEPEDRNEDAPQPGQFTIDDLLNMTDGIEKKPESEPEKTPADDYLSLKNSLPEPVLRELDKLEKEFRGKPFSYDAVLNRLKPLSISDAQKRDAAVKLEKYLSEQSVMQPAVQTTSPTDIVVQPASQISEDEIPQIPLPNSPVIQLSSDMMDDDQRQKLLFGDKAKAVDAVKGNYSSLKYREYQIGNKIVIRNEYQPDGGPVLDDKIDLRLLVPGVVDRGDSVELSVDTQWQGQINTDEHLAEDEYGNRIQREDKFENYLTDGKIDMSIRPGDAYPAYANMPVKIVHGKTGAVTYLPRIDWITAQQGAEDYRNVEDYTEDAEGNRVPGNVQLQVDRVLAIRKRLAEMYNANPAGARLKTRVKERTDGHIMYSAEVNPNTGKIKFLSKLASKQLPDSSLTFLVLEPSKNEVDIFKGHLQPFDRPFIALTDKQKQKMSGAPAVAIPQPNGYYRIVPLVTRTFAERQGDLNTVIRAIELYYKHGTSHWNETDQKHLDHIKKTGFNITTEQGLNDFVNQYYTYTHDGFEDAVTRADAAAVNGKKVQQFMLSIPKKNEGYSKTLVKVGTSFSGHKPIYAQLKGGVLDPVFVDALKAGLMKRFKNVTYAREGSAVTGINDNRPVTAVRINSDGSTWSQSYSNYNEYLKTFTETSVYGKHQVNGQYVYAANSQVVLNADDLLAPSKPIESEVKLPDQVQTEGKKAKSKLINLQNDSLLPDFTEYKISPEGEPVSLESLRELHSFTDEADRNNKTPEEVLEQLQKLGITHLAEGYNPFIKC